MILQLLGVGSSRSNSRSYGFSLAVLSFYGEPAEWWSQASLRGGARCKSSEECNGARENSSEDEEMTVMIMTMKADYYYYSVR